MSYTVVAGQPGQPLFLSKDKHQRYQWSHDYASRTRFTSHSEASRALAEVTAFATGGARVADEDARMDGGRRS